MAAEEQAAITRLIEKHSQEMLLMIQEKVRVWFNLNWDIVKALKSLNHRNY